MSLLVRTKFCPFILQKKKEETHFRKNFKMISSVTLILHNFLGLHMKLYLYIFSIPCKKKAYKSTQNCNICASKVPSDYTSVVGSWRASANMAQYKILDSKETGERGGEIRVVKSKYLFFWELRNMLQFELFEASFLLICTYIYTTYIDIRTYIHLCTYT